MLKAQDVKRRKYGLSRRENQSPTILFNYLSLDIVRIFVFLSLDQNIGAQPIKDRSQVFVVDESVIDNTDSGCTFQPKLFRNLSLASSDAVAAYTNPQFISLFFREHHQSKVPWMHDIEVPSH